MQNAAVTSIVEGKSQLGNLSLSEEALLLAAAYRKKPQSMFIIKNNAYTAQKLYDRLECLLEDDVLLFSVEESGGSYCCFTGKQSSTDGNNGKAFR